MPALKVLVLLSVCLCLGISAGTAEAAAGPSAPINLTATPGNGQVALTWQPPADTGGSPIAFYTVTASPGSFSRNTSDAATTSMTVTGLTNGTPYTFSVTATNSSGAGPAATATATPQAPPPPPSPSIAVNAFITLDVTAGGPNTTITVSGGSFFANQQMSIYWDTPTKVIGSTTTDAHGQFGNVKVKPFAGDKPGLHHICASVQPNPCAQFALQGAPTPTPSIAPSPSASPSESPSPSESASPTPTPVPIPAANNTNGLDVLLKPPFIFLPFVAALALLAAIAYWFIAASRRRDATLPEAAITHRTTRPGYGLTDFDVRPAPLGPTPGDINPAPPAPPEGPDEAPPITES